MYPSEDDPLADPAEEILVHAQPSFLQLAAVPVVEEAEEAQPGVGEYGG